MPPNPHHYPIKPTGILNEIDAETFDGALLKPQKPLATERKYVWVWRNIFWMAVLHLLAVIGAWRYFTLQAKWQTVLFTNALYLASGLGITAGAHRLWSHRSYKAKWPLRLILMIFNTIAFQDSLIDWSKDHRNHHKFTDTDADPYNAQRGFFYSHIGWLLTKKHQDVRTEGKKVDISDLTSDPIASFQKKYYLFLFPIFCFLLPTIIPVWVWGETSGNAFLISACFRYAFVLNVTWCVNSVAHIWGHKPYDVDSTSAQNPGVSLFAFGEGWHNFHHAFPWDYKTDEFGAYQLNLSKLFIDLMAKIGWAYDLKTVSPEMVKMRINRTGVGAKTTMKDNIMRQDGLYGK